MIRLKSDFAKFHPKFHKNDPELATTITKSLLYCNAARRGSHLENIIFETGLTQNGNHITAL